MTIAPVPAREREVVMLKAVLADGALDQSG
jgi:hypothetical protein